MDYTIENYKWYDYEKYIYWLYKIDWKSFDTKSWLKRYINTKYFL